MFIKPIAGDDLLLPNCIQDNMNFIFQNKNAEIVFSQQQVFGEDTKRILLFEKLFDETKQFIELDSATQYKMLMKNVPVLTGQTMFYRRSLLEKLDWYDERYPMLEDWPFYAKLAANQIKMHYFEKETAGHRAHNNSITGHSAKKYVHPGLFKSHYMFFKEVRSKHLNWLDYWDGLLSCVIMKLVIISGNKSDRIKIFRWIHVLNPNAYGRKIKAIVSDRQ